MSIDSANAWSLLEYRARDRMVEFLKEAEQDRLACQARAARRAESRGQRSAGLLALASGVQSALAGVAGRLALRQSGSRDN